MTSNPPPLPEDRGLATWRANLPALLLLGVLALILWTLYRAVGILVPLLAAVLLLWPERDQPWARRILQLLILLGTLWILHETRMVVYPLVAGLLVAYWLDPLVDRMEKRRIPRSVGALVVLVPILVIGALFAFFVVPLLLQQLSDLIRAIPDLYLSLREKLEPWIGRYLPVGASPAAGGGPSSVAQTLGQHLETILTGIWGGATSVTRAIGAVLTFLGMVVLAPVLSYYLLADFPRIRGWLRQQVGAAGRERFLSVFAEFEAVVGPYLRGQVLVSLVVGILLTIGYLIIGLPYAILLGFLAAVLGLIPILGFWSTMIFTVPAALLAPHPGTMLVRLLIVIVIEQLLEQQVLVPRIVGKAMGLNPAAVSYTHLRAHETALCISY
ncbi:MAG: AI-2E family transporter, partial [Candidatus Eisenbacteria bacterium]|nr:AI-2E family transporter [Candidatus Eisenbacteria bacterium]